MPGPDKILRGIVRPILLVGYALAHSVGNYSRSAPPAGAAKNASTSAMLWVRR
jgi:hypothetical protein